MTTTRTTPIPARDITAGMTILFRSRFRTVLSDASLQLDDDCNVYAYAIFEAMQGETLNLCVPADTLIPVVS